MKIIHLCLSCFYIDHYAYQENELIAQNVRDGHDVVVIASTESFGSDRTLTYVKPGEYMGSDGARVIRLPYRKFLPHAVMKKLRMHPGLYNLLQKENPDVLFFHGLCGWELLTIRKFKKNNPNTIIYADSHEDWNNSARSFISKNILHGLYYKNILRLSLGAIEKIYCVSLDTINFVHNFYAVPQRKIEFLPLGGKILDDQEYISRREKSRLSLKVMENEILLVQTGKIDRAKKLIESLEAFSKTSDQNKKFFIAGVLLDDVKDEVEDLIKKDSRVSFLGWKNTEELRDLLCAADVYVQPGSQSATMQMSLCCRCVVIINDVESHAPFINNNGWLIKKNQNLDQIFHELSQKSITEIRAMALESNDIARKLLDYSEQAKLIYAYETEKSVPTLKPGNPAKRA